jgi:hypothetical protein
MYSEAGEAYSVQDSLAVTSPICVPQVLACSPGWDTDRLHWASSQFLSVHPRKIPGFWGWWPLIPFEFHGSKEQRLVNVSVIVFYNILDSPAKKTNTNFPRTGPRSVSYCTSQIMIYRYNLGAGIAQSLLRPPGFDSRQNNFFSPQRIPARAHPTLYQIGTGGSFPMGKVAGAWSWPFTSI